ncbi:MAG TPA: TonB-dependent receptor [Steroidobacteraceae bacterium]|nr:TonB-dependent receptor [Steroidobacteraceae bacterium]
MFACKNKSNVLVLAVVVAAVTPAAARADVAAVSSSTDPAVNSDPTPSELQGVVISAQRLDIARAGIETQTGASTYTINAEAIKAAPGGDNVQLNQVILQAPGVAQDSFGQMHIRGEHNGLQYRLNGIILPEGIAVFGQTLDPRLIQSLNLVTGALPAEYGLDTAGIIDLTTKSGALERHGAVSVYGGSHGEIQPSIYDGGTVGRLTYFATGDYLRSDLGIESPDSSPTPLHDTTKQYHGFGYFDYLIDSDTRVSLILASSHDRFQIPDQAGLTPGLGLTVNGITDYPSASLDENQTEINHYGIVSLEHLQGALDLQTSFIARYASVTYTPDVLGDLLYDGIAQNAFKRDVSYGWQTDASYHLGSAHTVRAGFYAQYDKATSDTTSQVLLLDINGNQTSDAPLPIIDNGRESQSIESVYLQDEWKLLQPLTLNYGVRFDHYSAYSHGQQLSPRVNLVWKPIQGMTVHAGYSRYFSPPPFELVGGKTLSEFVNTTAAASVDEDSPPLAEKANYYDIGIEERFTNGFTTGVDTYYKQSVNLIDEGQFGAPIILTPFNYRYGQQYGAEFTESYSHGPFAAYLNFATQRARGKAIETAQFNFGADDLAYIADHWISLDHEQQYTASAGTSYRWGSTLFSADMLFGSGLRADLVLPDGSSIPNGAHLPYYRQVNLGVSHAFTSWGMGSKGDYPTMRFDITNVFDTVYEIRNGTGVGVGAPQFGPRRGFFVGISLPF